MFVDFDPSDVDMWRTLTLGLAALGQVAFATLYMTFPWWKTFLGRALFYKAVMLAVLVTMGWTSRTFGFGRTDLVFVPLYGLLAIGIWWQFIAFLRVKREGSTYKGPERRKNGALS